MDTEWVYAPGGFDSVHLLGDIIAPWRGIRQDLNKRNLGKPERDWFSEKGSLVGYRSVGGLFAYT
jgi:hypothetical protein